MKTVSIHVCPCRQLVILLLFGIAGLALGFLPPNILLPLQPKHVPTFGSSFVLCHAKKGTRKKMANADGKKKKNKQSNKSLYEKEVARASQKASVVLPGVKTRAPPWQVLSSEDAKQNVKQEKIRRKRAREEGIHQVPETTNEQLKSKALMSDANRMLLKWKRFNPTTEPCGISFIGSYLEKRLPPKLGVPEVAFLGRSNVGKSSLLNRLSSSAKSNKFAKDEARVGKTPGATASVNLYAMLGKAKQNTEMSKPILGLADLPGFGYAKLSKDVKEAVQLAAERYLGKREELALGILLVDARRDPSEDDRAVLAALYDMGVPLVVVATKVDKLAKSEVEPSLEIIRRGLGLPHGQPLCVSSVTGEGTKELWKIVLEACEVHVEELRDKLERANAEKNDAEDGSYETLTLGDKGNPLLFEDDEDVVYDQGFDWVHDSAVMYDGGDSEGLIDGDDEVEVGDQWEDDEGDGFEDMEYDNKEAFRLKNLKKRVRGMERRGEI